MTNPRSTAGLLIGILFIGIGLAVFGIRLIHAGPYAMPHGAALFGGIGAIVLGGILLGVGRFRPFGWIAVAVSPLALFPALYSIMGESEEVISLYARDSQENVVDLRLWIVDRPDGAWVGMAREKALAHGLDGQTLSMLRAGELVCVVPRLHDDRDTAAAVHAMKVEKYAVAQIFGSIGLYPTEATAATVALHLEPCPTS